LGFKASFGRIPYPGGAASQTTCCGALVTSVADAARHLDVAAGPDDRDRTSLPAPGVHYEEAVETLDVRRLTAAWSGDLGFAVVHPEVAGIAEHAARELIGAAGLIEVDRPVSLTDPVQTWLRAGAMDLWPSVEPGMWPDRAGDFEGYVRAPLAATEHMEVRHLARVWQARHQLEQELAAWFGGADVLLTPATAVTAFPAEGRMPEEINGIDVHPAMTVPFTMLANLCWNPAVSVPAGRTAAGLPVGLQIMVRRHADEVALRLARIFEQACPWPRLAVAPQAP
jgi:aspartyl-tRNA(Asn)/glutamyl-tRNA(Gln) amidotransferase subunit A